MESSGFHLFHAFSCNHCKKGLTKSSIEHMLAYFNEQEICCIYCGEAIDWWVIVQETIFKDQAPMQTLACIGAHWTIIRISVTPNKVYQLDLTQHNIPSDAVVLDISGKFFIGNFIGKIAPLEMKLDIRPRHHMPLVIDIFPAALQDLEPGEHILPLFVTWIPKLYDDYSWRSLTDAFHAYISGNYTSVIVPANVTVETLLHRLVSAYLEFIANKSKTKRERVKSFLQDAATYSHQLNIVLPSILNLTDIPQLPEHVISKLNTLRNRRNNIAHQGRLSGDFSKKEAAEMLTTALFAFYYLKFIASRLIPYTNVLQIFSPRARREYARGLDKSARVDYESAGKPYGDTNEGFTKWLEEQIKSIGLGNTEFGSL